jgi:hypothetical protein
MLYQLRSLVKQGKVHPKSSPEPDSALHHFYARAGNFFIDKAFHVEYEPDADT